MLKEKFTIYFKISIRSNHQSLKKSVLRNFAKFTGKHLCQSLFFNKVAGTLAQVFSFEFCKIFKKTFFYGTLLDDCFCTIKRNLIKSQATRLRTTNYETYFLKQVRGRLLNFGTVTCGTS